MTTLNFNQPSTVTLRVPAYQRVRITLVGCGGNGSHLATGLATLALKFQAQSIPCAIRFIDPDHVALKNVGRQLFAEGEVGHPKARVLSERLNVAYELAIAHTVRPVIANDLHVQPGALNIVVGAVDNAAARAEIAKAVNESSSHLWWLDCGNERHSGQIALGNEINPKRLVSTLGLIDRLPAPHVVYPDLISTKRPRARRADGRGQSCAELVDTGEQGLMLNRLMAAWALTMLHAFLFDQLRYFALDVSAEWGGVKAHLIDEPTLQEFCK